MLASRLRREALRPDVTLVSPIRRARETAEHVAAAIGCELNFDPDLQEVRPGEAEGMTWDQYAAFFGSTEGWDPNVAFAPGAESWERVRRTSLPGHRSYVRRSCWSDDLGRCPRRGRRLIGVPLLRPRSARAVADRLRDHQHLDHRMAAEDGQPARPIGASPMASCPLQRRRAPSRSRCARHRTAAQRRYKHLKLNLGVEHSSQRLQTPSFAGIFHGARRSMIHGDEASLRR